MKIRRDEFRALQKLWYGKLAEHGFKDIEKQKGDDFTLIQSASHCYKGTDLHSRQAKEEYYATMAKTVHDDATFFRNEIDRYILTRHVEGAKIKVIVKELMMMNISRHRHSIRFIIRRYEMAWGLRHYNYQQLNIKKTA
jgi:hypothetical protein